MSDGYNLLEDPDEYPGLVALSCDHCGFTGKRAVNASKQIAGFLFKKQNAGAWCFASDNSRPRHHGLRQMERQRVSCVQPIYCTWSDDS